MALRTNLWKNPTFAADKTGFPADPADCVYTAAKTDAGVLYPEGITTALKCAYTGTTYRDYISASAEVLSASPSTAYVLSWYIYIPALAATGHIRVDFQCLKNGVWSRNNSTIYTATNSGFTAGYASLSLAADENGLGISIRHRYAAITSYFTGFIIELGATPGGSYFDGRWRGKWSGAADASVSIAAPYSMMGGRFL